MVMNAFDTNFDDENEVYAVNTVAHAYMKRPIVIDRTRPVRVYLVNVTEFDPINSFHLHGNFFDYYDHGTTLTPTLRTVDTVMQCQAQRGILEFSFAEHEPGHVHVPRAPVGVRRAGLDEPVRRARRGDGMSRPLAWALLPLALIVLIGAAFLASDPLRPFSAGVPPVEELTVERTVLDGDGIALLVRAGGSEPMRDRPGAGGRRLLGVHAGPAGAAAAPRHRLAAHPLPLGAGRDAPHRAAQPRRRAVRAHDRRGGGDADPRQPDARWGSSACSSASCRWRWACCSTRRSRPAAGAPSTSRWRSRSGSCCFSSSTRWRRRWSWRPRRRPASTPRPWSGWSPRMTAGLLYAVGQAGRPQARAASASPPRSRSASACTIWARGWRSARPSRPVPRRSAPSWSSASRCTTSPRASASWHPWSRRGTGCRPSSALAALAGLPAVAGIWLGSYAFAPHWAALALAVGAGAIFQVVVEVGCCSLRRARSQGGQRGDGSGDGGPGRRHRRHVRDGAARAGVAALGSPLSARA